MWTSHALRDEDVVKAVLEELSMAKPLHGCCLGNHGC
jgi:hypothetical protein